MKNEFGAQRVLRKVLSAAIATVLLWTTATTVPGHGYETARCADHAAILNPLAASVSRAFCSALI